MSSGNPSIQEVEFLRILWCDNANIIRSKAIYLNRGNVKPPFKVGISAAQQGVPVMYDGVVPDSGLSPVGEIELEADLSSFSKIPYAPGNARAMGFMKKEGDVWDCCPRGFLDRIIREFSSEDMYVKASFENEFYLLKDSPNIIPSENTPFASTFSMDLNNDFIKDLAQTLTLQGIIVEQYYAEAGPGQQEVTMKYEDPLKAADNQIIFRETVKALAHEHGLRSSFLPKIFSDGSGSGCHLHLSLWKDGKNILGDPDDIHGLSRPGKQFIAGILQHLPGLMALTTPSVNSYHRIIPHSWSGAYQCWGIDNREAAVRVISHPQGVQHFELKTVDASSNPYLALGAVIAAGFHGIRQSLELEEPVQQDPGNISAEDLKTSEISLLPQSLGESMANLEKDDLLINALGPALSKAYLGVKKAEIDYFKDLTMEEEVELLLEKY